MGETRISSRHRRLAAGVGSLVFGVAIALVPAQGQEAKWGLPVICPIGETCFVQQMPDMAMGGAARDPLCGMATYDGHDGWDIRLRSLSDIAEGVAVVAVGPGLVLRARDRASDHLVAFAQDRERVRGTECGNGVVVAHAKGLTTQYCHLKRGSVSVKPGSKVRKGQQLGFIGASGLAAFPHVHLTVRRNGTALDPLTGQILPARVERCGDISETLFDVASREALGRPAASILAIGLSSTPPDIHVLVRDGGPPVVRAGDTAILLWAWAVNVEAGWRFHFRLEGGDARALLDKVLAPLDRRKASFVAYAGRRQLVRRGTYMAIVEVLDGLRVVGHAKRQVVVE